MTRTAIRTTTWLLLGLVLAARGSDSPRRVLLARWTLGRVDEQRAAALQEALAGEIAATWQCSTLTFAHAAERLRSKGFELFEACRDEACAAAQAEALGCTHAVIGSVSGMGEAYRMSLRMVDAPQRKTVSRCDRVLEGPHESIVLTGMREIAGVLCHGEGLPEGEPLIVREVVRDRGRERARLFIGIAAGIAVATGASIAIINYAERKSADEPDRETSPIVFEW